jgi:protein SCO1/2
MLARVEAVLVLDIANARDAAIMDAAARPGHELASGCGRRRLLHPSRTRFLTARVVLFLASAVVASGALLGCHQPSAPATGVAAKQYPIRGVVTGVFPAQQGIMLSHEAIPGLMEAMTMQYKVVDPAVLTEVHGGDRITATLLADSSPDGPTNLRLKDVVIIQQAKPDYLPKVQYHVPAPGDALPDFALRDQSGDTIHLNGFHGKVLLLTFVYTRCPLADYCPRMSHNFADINKDLAADPRLYAKTHLLSISFDPQYDTPAVLRSYGGAYTGRYTQETFTHWTFAAPREDDLKPLEQWFDLGVTPGTGNTLTHSLSTVLVDQNGKVAAFYPDNDWKVSEVEARIRQLLVGESQAASPAPHRPSGSPKVAP